ncbi:hypothetical protein F9L07_24525 [Pimelobacter simplex]|uniref:DUF4209 domain-containing protein n=1 Tax=Nocardioides simplex TaxID=2045 RepID=A0A7J5DSC2_NOCSI|nr:hypothetical protein [Pimelobacter simplex]KAB2807855.1 hypothetical protein F9L07_24525 [Pimelobacter simplex]
MVDAAELPYTSEDVARVAGMLDRAAAEVSRHRRFTLARELFVEPHLAKGPDAPSGEVSGTEGTAFSLESVEDEWADEEERAAAKLPVLEAAAWAAMRYHVEFTIEGKKERARLEPHFKGPDSSDPVDTDRQGEVVVDAWTALAGAVTFPGARAALSHLVFQAASGREYAQAAAVAYLELSESDVRAVDMVSAARAAVRLARAVGDKKLAAGAVAALERAAQECVNGERRSVGGAQQALETLVREGLPRASELIEAAVVGWGPEQVGQQFWHLKLQTATDDADREQIWRDRVAAATAVAEASSSNILKATRLRDVLALAEASGIAELREQAAVLVQGIRNLDLEMMTIRASSHQFEEQFEEVVASVLGDPYAGDFTARWIPDIDPVDVPDGGDGIEAPALPTWYARLRAFAQHGPPTGDPDQSRAHIENQHRLAPLQRLFPTSLQTPEGLPFYAPESDEDRFDLDMVKWEAELLQQWTVIYAEALHRVVDTDLPPFKTLVGVLSEGGEPSAIGHQLAESFYRYWAGDGAAALHTTIPMIEALVRDAVIRADRGIYRLQKNQSPGQYVGLGVLLPLFYDIYDVSEKDQRFFNAVLKHPGGWNLRNLLSHGYLPAINGGVAALALYAALRVLVLTDKPTRDDDVTGTEAED